MIPSAREQIRFLQNVQRVLEEGVFTATYKYALLLTLADIAVERGDERATPLTISAEDLAERFVGYYWRQARPYQPRGGSDGVVLRQNTGKQAKIVTLVGKHQHTTLSQLRKNRRDWKALVRYTQKTILGQPLWRLQLVGGEPFTFLYDHAVGATEIELKGEAVYCLRHFHGLVHNLVTAAWVRFVRQLPANRPVLGHHAELAEFLFGTERAPLGAYRSILVEVQKGRCFYCTGRLAPASVVDHFVPWSRYPVDLGHNFVVAHTECNNRKRDSLADVPHLERWMRRNEDYRTEMEQQFDEAAVAHDLAASLQIARWAYRQAAASRSLVWSRGNELVPLKKGWHSILRSP